MNLIDLFMLYVAVSERLHVCLQDVTTVKLAIVKFY